MVQTSELSDILANATTIACEKQQSQIEPTHVLKAILEHNKSCGRTMLRKMDLPASDMLRDLHRTHLPKGDTPEAAPTASEKLQEILRIAEHTARRLGHEVLGSDHVLIAIGEEPSPISTLLCHQHGFTPHDACEIARTIKHYVPLAAQAPRKERIPKGKKAKTV